MHPPVLSNDSKINEISFKLSELRKQVFTVRWVLFKFEGALSDDDVDLEIIKCMTETVSDVAQKMRSPDPFQETGSVSVMTINDKGKDIASDEEEEQEEGTPPSVAQQLDDTFASKVQVVKDDLRKDYKGLLAARSGIAHPEHIEKLDKSKKKKLVAEYIQNLDQQIAKAHRKFREIVISYFPDNTPAPESFQCITNHLNTLFQEAMLRHDKLFDSKTNVGLHEYETQQLVDPKIQKLREERRQLFARNITDIFLACQFGDLNFIQKELNSSWFKQRLVNQATPVTDEGFYKIGGYTPLQIACYHNHLLIVDLIFKHTKPLMQDAQGYTALHWAAKSGSVGSIAILLTSKHVAKMVEAKAAYGRTPLHMSVHNGHLGATEQLLQAGANINAQTTEEDSKKTPLLIAATMGNLPMVRALCERPHLDVNICDAKGYSSFYYAVSSGFVNIALAISKHRSFVTSTNLEDINSPISLLKITPERNKKEIERLLLDLVGRGV